jgi:hypothetical protein
MTDLETMRAMLQRAKIEFTERTRRPNELSEIQDPPDAVTILEIEGGYSGFLSKLSFDGSGALHDVAAYE